MDRSELKVGEPHPSAEGARRYLNSLGLEKLSIYAESFASCAIEGNRLAEVCSGTLQRIFRREPISDRYLLGLVWAIRDMEETNQEKEDKG